MTKINIKRNSEDVTVNIFIQKLGGSPMTRLVYESQQPNVRWVNRLEYR